MRSQHTPWHVRKISYWHPTSDMHSWLMLAFYRAHMRCTVWQALCCSANLWCTARQVCAVSISQTLSAGDNLFFVVIYELLHEVIVVVESCMFALFTNLERINWRRRIKPGISCTVHENVIVDQMTNPVTRNL